MSFSEDVNDNFQEIYIGPEYVTKVASVVNTKNEYLSYKRTNLVKTEEFYKRLLTTFSVKGVVLPRNCRYVDINDNGYKLIVIEDPPAVRTVNVDFDFSSCVENFKITGKDKVVKVDDLIGKTRPYKITLSFPYVIYVLLFNQLNRFMRMKVFYRLSPISSEYDYLLKANLPNIGGHETVCLGDIKNDYDGLSEGVNSVISAFWANSFNTDYITNYAEYAEQVPEFKDFVSWAYHTAVDPMFIFNVKYLKYENHLKKACDLFFQHYGEPFVDSSRILSNLKKILTRTPIIINGQMFSSRIGSIDSCFLKNKPLSIGDQITIDEKTFYINDIILDQASGHVSYLNLEDTDGSSKMVNVQKIPASAFKIKESLVDKIKLADGSEVSAGDSIIVNYPFKKIKTIEKIRLGRDGNFEVMLKGDPSDYYLLDKIDARKMGEIKPRYSSIDIKKDEEYIIYRNTNDMFKYFSHILYTGHEVTTEGDIILTFNENKKYIPAGQTTRRWRVYCQGYHENEEALEYTVIKTEDLKEPATRTFRILNKLYQLNNKDVFVVKDCVIMDERKYNSGEAASYNKDLAIQDLIKSDGNKLLIPSYDSDIEFNVGDDVVVADWTNIYDMVTPRKIHSFVYDEQYLFILTIDPETGVLRKDKYIDFKQNMVYVGSIRKINLNVKNLENGNIIVAKTPRIPYFLKKDVNKIVGLITDTISHPPLVLCSNGLTLWADEMDQFEIYPKRHRMYNRLLNKLSPAVDPTELKDQLGDFYIIRDNQQKTDVIYFYKNTPSDFSSKNYSYFLNIAYPMEKNSYTIRNTINVHNKPESYSRYGLRRYGFCRPRYSERRKAEERFVRAFPNLLGGYIKSISQFSLYEK